MRTQRIVLVIHDLLCVINETTAVGRKRRGFPVNDKKICTRCMKSIVRRNNNNMYYIAIYRRASEYCIVVRMRLSTRQNARHWHRCQIVPLTVCRIRIIPLHPVRGHPSDGGLQCVIPMWILTTDVNVVVKCS